jgi:hypothetical protein
MSLRNLLSGFVIEQLVILLFVLFLSLKIFFGFLVLQFLIIFNFFIIIFGPHEIFISRVLFNIMHLTSFLECSKLLNELNLVHQKVFMKVLILRKQICL